MPLTRRRFIHVGLFAGGCSATAWTDCAAQASPPDANAVRCQAMADKIRPLFEKKKAPKPFDWLATRDEPGQTFSQYLASGPNRPVAGRSKLYLQPIGEFSETEKATVPVLKEFMHLFFGLEVQVLPKIGLEGIPDSARRIVRASEGEQILTTHVLDKILLPKRPKDAVAVLAITPSDLWAGEGWNFVFGQASLKARVGVWSTARFGDPEKAAAQYLRRVLQVAVHETGHMFGIRHCIAFECCMNGSNGLDESDRIPLYYCPECDAKLWWACKLTPAARARELAAFSKRQHLEGDASQWDLVAKKLEDG